ncbi:SDR family oxidoreductase [Niabella sp. 22666]|uniref:SDR family oxidoreductase n=1 Tax=Niabella sp. 22666 TaxID=3453954 RepID=UPI003F8517AB
MIISLKNKKALVGGASQGLGYAIAWQLAASGASVTVMARNEEKLRTIVSTLPVTEGQRHNYLVVDFADLDSYKKIMDTYFSANTVDILVNNTNGPKAGTVLEKTGADYQSAFNLLFQTVQHTTALAVKHMKEQGFGRIVNLTSRTIKEPVDSLALSNTIRAAVVAWGKTLSRDLGKYHITVNNILTGNFDTERLTELFEAQAKAGNATTEAIKAKAIADIPLQRLGTAAELANVVTFLASEQAAYVTGTSIPVDGGLLKSI